MTALDVYSDLKVPFEVAVWCRGHKLNVTAVNIARALRGIKSVREQIAELEAQEANTEDALKFFIEEAQRKMENGNGL